MKKTVCILFITSVLLSCNNTKNIESIAVTTEQFGLVPQPHDIKLKPGTFHFTTNTHFVLENISDLRIAKFIKENFTNPIAKEKGKQDVVLRLITPDTLTKPEIYMLDVQPEQITISAVQPAGLYYGLQTLQQLLPTDFKEKKTGNIQALNIYDYPQFAWRGAHLDVSRHFFDVAFIKKYIDLLSKHKMNTFHWHLVDDQGWRIEIKKYPKLTEIGSKRKETVVKKHFKPFVGDHTPYSGFYTQKEIKEVVSYANNHFITVIPEIEMPGHSLAALTAYPQYSCTGGPFEVGKKWGVFKDIYCAGNDSTFVFLENILAEVMALFPSKYIHIGGDEAPKTRWKNCPKCQARIKQEGLKDAHELQSYFIKRIEKYVNSKGRQIIGWDEILEGGLAPNAAVMSWRGEKGGIRAAKKQHYVVMSPGKPLYFDHYQSKNRENEPFAIGGYNSLQSVYEYNPIPTEISVDNTKYILGAQANVWTEYITTPNQVMYMAYPRLSALSEVVWTGNQKPGYDSFLERMQIHQKRLKNWQVTYRSLDKK